MTCILGYISDNPEDKTSMFLASDGRLDWYFPEERLQLGYPKIFRFNDFLLSFNGEVRLFEEVKKKLKHIGNEIDSIHELEDGINDGFNFEYLRATPSQSSHSNLIILDIKHRSLAHHYAGDLHARNSFPFRFELLEKNTLYHFGSVMTFLNRMHRSNDPYNTESLDFIKETLERQKESIIALIKESKRYGGIGELHSYYILDKEENQDDDHIDVVEN